MDYNHSENTKRIAKNTIFLYGRLFFGMVVSLYTSRVILNALGVENYGIQNVVGGFLGMLTFLNASMSGATSRFITYELGKNNLKKLSETFNTAFLIHGVLSLLILLVAETAGLWFLENKLIIPEGRMFAARIVYQLSIAGLIIGMMLTPYNATIIAHEKMGVFAYFDILGILLRLSVVYLLMILKGDKLILCSILYLCVSVIMFTIYRVYCLKNFGETKFKLCYNKSILRPMLSFSGWDLYGNASVMLRTQGVTVLLNLFFGPIVNAASGIATQVQGAVMSFSNNIITAYRPQIIKQYACDDYDYLFELLRDAIKISTLLLMIVTIPLMAELEFVIMLWLGTVPEYVVPICRWTLVFNFFTSISVLFAAVIHATGRIKRISIINGSLYLLVVPIVYILYKLGNTNPVLPFIVNVIAIFIGVLSNAYTIKLYIPSFKFINFIIRDYIPGILLFLSTYLFVSSIMAYMEQGWLRLFVSISLSVIILLSSAFIFYLPVDLRNKILVKIKSKLSFCRL